MTFGLQSEDVGLIVCAISFQDFQTMWSWSTNVTDRRTDGKNHTTTFLCILLVAVSSFGDITIC